MIIKVDVGSMRDPFILVEDDAYYMYGSGPSENDDKDTVWTCYKNTSGRLDGEWLKVDGFVQFPEDAVKNRWAPEVHKYKGKYYLFATYFSAQRGKRGCSILRADKPDGTFREITDGHITPPEWDAIDGTLYVDEDNTPWMIFVREWTCMDDNVGRMAVARLSDDLTHFTSEPIELFRADSPSWTDCNITDGPYMYKTRENSLLMLWSNFENNCYCVGVARSENGKVDGKWIQEDKLLFSEKLSGGDQGGHGMIFTDRDGQKYLSLHTVNWNNGDKYNKATFIPVSEYNDALICQF